MSGPAIAVGIETSDINSDLNSVVLFIFFMGIYTVVYFGTIYLYFTKNRSKCHFVPTAITILYLSTMVETACQWWLLKWQFVDNGDTRQSAFSAINNDPQWVYTVDSIAICIIFVVADTLLIWRCFFIWNRSLRVISLSLFLIVAEFALFLVEVSLNAKYFNLIITAALAARLNAVFAAAFFVSFGTTIVTTVLIAYRIYSVLNQQGASSRRFKHIMDIVVQSGAVYALSQLVAAIAGVVPQSDLALNTRVFALQDYALVLNAIAGISTTVMVARVVMLSEDTTYPSTSAHLSGLQFYARSTHPTVNIEAVEVTHSIDGVRISSGEGKSVEEKADKQS